MNLYHNLGSGFVPVGEAWKTWKALDFYCGISRIGKSWKKAYGPKSFGNLLNLSKKYDVYGRQ